MFQRQIIEMKADGKKKFGEENLFLKYQVFISKESLIISRELNVNVFYGMGETAIQTKRAILYYGIHRTHLWVIQHN